MNRRVWLGNPCRIHPGCEGPAFSGHYKQIVADHNSPGTTPHIAQVRQRVTVVLRVLLDAYKRLRFL